jgi:hypothetical protein
VIRGPLYCLHVAHARRIAAVRSPQLRSRTVTSASNSGCTTADQLTPLERATAFIRSLRSGATERFMRAAAVLRPMSMHRSRSLRERVRTDFRWWRSACATCRQYRVPRITQAMKNWTRGGIRVKRATIFQRRGSLLRSAHCKTEREPARTSFTHSTPRCARDYFEGARCQCNGESAIGAERMSLGSRESGLTRSRLYFDSNTNPKNCAGRGANHRRRVGSTASCPR